MSRAHPTRFAAAASGAALVLTAGLLTAWTGAASADPGHGGRNATVYTETNAVSGNAVLAYRQHPDGTTSPLGIFATDGNGTGAGLGSQGAVALSSDGQLLAAVNAGSESVSLFSVDHDGGLDLIDTPGSGGVDPISVTINGGSVYVLNAGDSARGANIAGFGVYGDHLVPQPSNVQPLNAAASSPEEISFSPDGAHLVVTEKVSGTVDVFPVTNGAVGAPVTTTLGGTGVYGFAFTPSGVAVISESAYGGLASFTINPSGTLQQISQVSDGQLAACWVALSSDGTAAYTANAHSGTVSFYSVASNGTLTLNNPAIATNPGAGDTDLAVSGHNANLDVLDHTQIDAAAIGSNGLLGVSNPAVTGLPASTDGLAATNS